MFQTWRTASWSPQGIPWSYKCGSEPADPIPSRKPPNPSAPARGKRTYFYTGTHPSFGVGPARISIQIPLPRCQLTRPCCCGQETKPSQAKPSQAKPSQASLSPNPKRRSSGRWAREQYGEMRGATECGRLPIRGSPCRNARTKYAESAAYCLKKSAYKEFRLCAFRRRKTFAHVINASSLLLFYTKKD